jgi:sec-independent protein translocase protein TatB
MFEVGFTEIIVILGLALLVLGPEKLPGLAEKVGRWTGRARSMARQLRSQLEQEVTLEQMAKSKPMQAQRETPVDSGSPEVSPTAAVHEDPPVVSTDISSDRLPETPGGIDLDKHFEEQYDTTPEKMHAKPHAQDKVEP